MPEDAIEDAGGLTELELERLCGQLEALCSDLERTGDWPREQFQLLADSGVLGWVIPAEFGGTNVSARQLTRGYIRLASACLTSTFVLTQRNGACQRIAGCDNEVLKSELLPGLCRGEVFATVGVSHLTTSRQHLKRPAVEVHGNGSTWRFEGTVPWVTGAAFADYIVTGGTCSDGGQVLAVIPTELSAVRVDEPPRLLALNSSKTASVRLDGAAIDERFLIAGPVENVMRQGQGGGAGSLTTSALALGAAAASLRRLSQEARVRRDLAEICDSLAREHQAVSVDIDRLLLDEAADENPAPSIESIRHRANSLVLRASQAHLAASKGAGFVQGHPAERAVREAMFFLVWSCPQPVLAAALREFACVIEP